jgi:hypothetical protein
MAAKLKAEQIKRTIHLGTLMGNLLYELAHSPTVAAAGLDKTDKERCLDLRKRWEELLREMEPANG